ncbi:MAG: 4Fe-4S dicluster domain-containing protein [Clostridia bacterium]|nr:4Fe-4S dicluster domain-containing protein [Clostridia bacterium]
MKFKILRQESPDSPPYWETFVYDGDPENSVAGALDHINFRDDAVNADGARTTRIGWECSCMQGVCGACAMVINDTPALACETFLRDLKGDTVTLRPLRKFPVVRDLIVDRSSIHENLTKANVCIGEYHPAPNEDHDHQYTAAKCLKCGLCLEVCPNYVNGKNFFGAAFANDCYLVAARNREKAGEIRAVYGEHFAAGCSKALSCMAVCPVKIPTLASMAKLNRSK